MKLAILCGGLGTRLRSKVVDVPKVMAPIRNKPFLEYLLNFFKKQGVSSFILSVGYKKESIENTFHHNYQNIPLTYIKEETPLGTGGAIVSILEGINKSEKSIFVSNGDTFLDISLKKLKDFHESNDMDITIALVHMKDFDRYGSVLIDNNRILSFKEKECVEDGLINAGTYILNSTLFDKFNVAKVFSFETFLQEHTKQLKIGAFVVKNGYFIDIGIPSDYAKAEIDFKDIF